MKKENKELIQEMLTAIYAKDKLAAVEDLIDHTKTDTIDKKKLKQILESKESDLFDD